MTRCPLTASHDQLTLLEFHDPVILQVFIYFLFKYSPWVNPPNIPLEDMIKNKRLMNIEGECNIPRQCYLHKPAGGIGVNYSSHLIQKMFPSGVN
jgi:hypothetical protein